MLNISTQMLAVLCGVSLVGFLYGAIDRKWEVSLGFLLALFVLGAALAFRLI